MKLTGETKVIIGIIITTLVVLFGGVYFLSKTSIAPVDSSPVDQNILVKNDSHKTGTESAKVTIVEFADFQCPACKAAHPVLNQLTEEFKDKALFVFRHFPLSTHSNARLAANAAESAGEQGKFWEMHDKLYETQNNWAGLNDKQATDLFVSFAEELKLDTDKFKESLESNKFADKIQRDIDDGYRAGVNSTPTFFINGVKQNSWGYEDFKSKINKLVLD